MRTYTGDQRRAVAFPLGGLGAGHVALGADGALRQWQLHSRPNHRGFLPGSFFALRVSSIEPPDDVCRLLRSAPIAPHPHPAPNVDDDHVPDAGNLPPWPPVTDTTFTATYPFANVTYHDETLPVDVSLSAHTPFVPLDADESGLPLVSYAFTVHNRSAELRHGWLIASLQNGVGWDGVAPIDGVRSSGYGGNVNRRYRRQGVVMDNPSLPDDDPRAGEMLLWADRPAAVLPRSGGAAETLRFAEALKLVTPVQLWDFSRATIDEALTSIPPTLTGGEGPSPAGHTWDAVLAIPFALAPGEETTIEVVHAWYFPNRYVDWDQFGPERPYGKSKLWLGTHYATRFGGVLDVLDHYRANPVASRAWADAVGTLAEPLAELISAQGTLVRSPTIFRTEDGVVHGFEGGLGASTRNFNGDVGGSCPVDCNHVYNYEQALSRLFPQLGATMRDTEWSIAAAEGYLPHRAVLPTWLPQLHGVEIGGPAKPALDGMLGAVLKTYRSVRDGAGLDWLRGHWPALRKLLTYVRETWDADGDGVLRGEQPVTYDIALHGPNMFVGCLWLAALRAAEEMGRLLSEDTDADRSLFELAAKGYDELLWNGEYYAQPPTGEAYDFGAGCLSDQLFGQWWANQLDLGHLLPADRVRTALRSIVRHNLRTGFEDHGYRVFADGDETGLVVCSWPRGGRPEVPLRYCDEVWTGVEYTVAALCLAEGLHDEGGRVIAALQRRHDGSRRNPFNEVECGDHYARAMAGWSVLDAVTGFRYNAATRALRVSAAPGTYPFVAGTAWGTFTVDGENVSIDVHGGTLPTTSIEVVR
ncbi:GH116 family glycosyl-hydrolase [Cryptosporangium japonicum]|uniref:Non-lysosomal glucosylceramidase n=1 Tax=Cryptosporangium japonicum TaxID=80872 RepID=A0ABN0UW50_9ACTN